MKTHATQPLTAVFSNFCCDTMQDETYLMLYDMLNTPSNNEHLIAPQKCQLISDYLNGIFMRAQDAHEIEYSIDGKTSYFKTGLQTAEHKDIYALFNINTGPSAASSYHWIFQSFVHCYM